MAICPECLTWKTKTLATRKDTRHNWMFRSKQCQSCGHRFETYEICVDFVGMPEPINPNGRLKK